MKRDLAALTDREFDVVIIGGGVFGACAAWDATLRGLRAAIIERADFGGATSANSFKMVHGGIRYLQHADIQRVKKSSDERRAFMRVAPHLVHPLPIVVPTYGRGMKGKAAMRIGMGLYDLLTIDRNRGISDPERQVPRGRVLSRDAVLAMFPALERDGLTGAAVFCDGQMYNPPRLVLAFVHSAVEAGAVAANHVRATGFLRQGGRVVGVAARDELGGRDLEIRARAVLNASGPYAEKLLAGALGYELEPTGTYSRDAAFVINRRVTDRALAVTGKTYDPDAIVSRGMRHLFVVPWRDYNLLGVWHSVHRGNVEDFTVTEAEIRAWIDEFNAGYPGFELTLDDVSMWNAGLVPFGENQPGSENLRYGHRSRLVDHARTHDLEGLVTLIGVRYTTGRCEAARAIDLIFRKLGREAPRCETAARPIHGGQIESVAALTREAIEGHREIDPDAMRCLVRNYGTAYREVLRYGEERPELLSRVGSSTTLRAEVVHAVRREMAQTLADVVFRRTDLGTGEHPGHDAIRICAELMADEARWNEGRKRDEIEAVESRFPFPPSVEARRTSS